MKNFVPRLLIVAAALIVLMSLLVIQLGKLTLAQGENYSSKAEDRSTRTITLRGTRGRITDRNGIVLAYNETCYNVEFLRDADKRTDYTSSKYTEAIIKTIQIVEEGGGKTIDTSYIRMNDKGELYYDWGVTDESIQAKRYYNFCSAMGFYVTEEIAQDKTKWKTPLSAYSDMCKSWHIPEEMPFEEAVKVISIRQEANLNNYKAYEPITIAYDVSVEVVSKISMRSDELLGIQVSESTTRIYPYRETAAHIVGYLQRNATEEMVKEKGYSYNDYVGVTGIESTMEEYLTGASTEHHGQRVIKVNKNGSEISEVSVTPATDGYDVMLTIDLPLQQVVDKALEDVIAKINDKERKIIEEETDNNSYYTVIDGNRVQKDIKTAETGAIVVLDATNGDVLAMSSYPSYDPNWFIKGLTDEQYEYLMGDEAKDTTPMRNKAISARLAPGSIFKPVTGLAGLMEGAITLDTRIDDQYTYYLYDENGEKIESSAAHCWTKNSEKHAHQDITDAIKNSCNYFFYEVANRLGIDKLNDWAGKLGLTSSTGIELTGEAKGIVGGQKVWYDNSLPLEEQQSSMPRVIYNSIRDKLVHYIKISQPGADLTRDSDEIKQAALEILNLQDGDITGAATEVRRIMTSKLGMSEAGIHTEWVTAITSDLLELQWKKSQTIRSGIGQGSTLTTPVAIARYAAAIANRGTVYNVHVVGSIQDSAGNVIKETEPEIFSRVEVPDAYWDAIHQGLDRVVSPEDEGTASGSFSKTFIDAGYTSKISGKTGSAQIGSIEKIDIQNTSWFIAYTPRENSEIVIVVCVPYGYSGASSVSAIEDIVTYYYERQDAAAPENLVNVNGITP